MNALNTCKQIPLDFLYAINGVAVNTQTIAEWRIFS